MCSCYAATQLLRCDALANNSVSPRELGGALTPPFAPMWALQGSNYILDSRASVEWRPSESYPHPRMEFQQEVSTSQNGVPPRVIRNPEWSPNESYQHLRMEFQRELSVHTRTAQATCIGCLRGRDAANVCPRASGTRTHSQHVRYGFAHHGWGKDVPCGADSAPPTLWRLNFSRVVINQHESNFRPPKSGPAFPNLLQQEH